MRGEVDRLVKGVATVALSALVVGCGLSSSGNAAGAAQPVVKAPATAPAGKALATFAGGCFWCMEKPFEKVGGVDSVVSGYIGGHVESPSYKAVCSGSTGHTEAVQVTYDPRVVSYDQLLSVFWRSFDPTDAGGQFGDRGSQYRPEVFFHDEAQRKAAEASKAALAASGVFDEPIVVPVTKASTFWVAEAYHQDYYRTHPAHYQRYFVGSGRAGFLERTWKDAPPLDLPKKAAAKPKAALTSWMQNPKTYSKPDAATLRQTLTPLQYRVTQEDGTERPFSNEFWDNKQHGLYVDVVSGEPLFSSTDKFKSGTGWPSFTRPVKREHVVEKSDRSHFMVRTEVRSKHGDSHLGHVFNDGPQPTGLRYCINSASLRFVPVSELEAQGYGEFTTLFEGVEDHGAAGSGSSRPLAGSKSSHPMAGSKSGHER